MRPGDILQAANGKTVEVQIQTLTLQSPLDVGCNPQSSNRKIVDACASGLLPNVKAVRIFSHQQRACTVGKVTLWLNDPTV